jgi:hypothetical protein
MYIVPIFVYSVFKWAQNRQSRWGIPTFVFIGATVVAHPLVGFLVIQVLVLTIITYNSMHWSRTKSFDGILTTQKSLFVSTALLSILYTYWYIFQTSVWNGFVLGLFQYIRDLEQPVSRTARVGDRLDILSESELIELLIIRFSSPMIMALLTVGGIIILFAYLWNNEGKYELGSTLLFILFLTWFGVNFIYLLSGLTVPEITFPPLRFVSTIYVFAPIFAGIGIHRYSSLSNTMGSQVVVLIMVFALLGGFSFISLYDGSHTTNFSGQQTEQELDGVSWLIDKKSSDISTIGFGSHRYEESLLGPHIVRVDRRAEFPRPFDTFGNLPPRLITDNGSFITDALKKDRYIKISSADYIQGFQSRLIEEDENRLSYESRKIYSNGGYQIYYG